MNKQEHQRHHLALEGRAWPEALEAFAVPLAHLAAAQQLLNLEPQAELWIGYCSPLELLSSTPASTLADGLARWAEQASAALELRASHPQRCRLLNLTLLDGGAIRSLLGGSEPEPAQSSAAPAEPPALDVRLQLVLRHRSDLAHLYADLEGCCELLGRQPQFVLPLEPLHGPALAQRCLESWGAEQRQREEQEQRLQSLAEELEERAGDAEAALKEAREEAELTLLQLHQVQEELEHVFLEHRQAAEERDGLTQRLSEAETALQQTRQELEARASAAEAALQEARSGAEAALHASRQELEARASAAEAALQEARGAAEAALKEAREEAELTLLQLHQVQEELEHYFLEHRKATEENQALQEKLDRLEQEALHLFLHATPHADLDHSRLERLRDLAREALQLQ